MRDLLKVIAWLSRAKTCYDFTQARNYNEVCLITAKCLLTEYLIYQANQDIRNQNYIK